MVSHEHFPTEVKPMLDAYIVSACRTPIGRLGGVLKDLTASDLGATVVRAAYQRGQIPPDQVDEVLMGNVIQAGQGQNPARQAAMKAGLPSAVPATTVNMVCGSGLKAVVQAAQAICLGDAGCLIAGGMSQAPFVLPRNAANNKMGHLTLLDLVLHEGLTDAFDGRLMGELCERLGERYGISREEQDAFAAKSQHRYVVAAQADRFADEIMPVTVPVKGGSQIVAQDEHPRPDTTLAGLSRLKPAFAPQGTITAGNASGVNDGAAAIAIASGARVEQWGLHPLARIVSWASHGTAPELFGIAPAGAVQRALAKAGLTLNDIGLIEANEAFAVQMLALSQEVGWDLEKVNVNGGAIALGHPIGASGARILVTLLHEMQRQRSRYGLATLCCGGGMGIAMIVESVAA